MKPSYPLSSRTANIFEFLISLDKSHYISIPPILQYNINPQAAPNFLEKEHVHAHPSSYTSHSLHPISTPYHTARIQKYLIRLYQTTTNTDICPALLLGNKHINLGKSIDHPPRTTASYLILHLLPKLNLALLFVSRQPYLTHHTLYIYIFSAPRPLTSASFIGFLSQIIPLNPKHYLGSTIPKYLQQLAQHLHKAYIHYRSSPAHNFIRNYTQLHSRTGPPKESKSAISVAITPRQNSQTSPSSKQN